MIPWKTGRRAGLLLRLAVSAALIAWILAKTPFSDVAAAFRSADPRWVLAALALVPFGCFASVRRWQSLIRAQGGDAALPFLVRSLLVGVFFNNFLPSTIGGDAIRALDTARAGVGRAKAVAIVFVDRFVGLLALMLFAVLGVLRMPSLYTWVFGGAAVGESVVELACPPADPARCARPDGRARAGRTSGRGARWTPRCCTQDGPRIQIHYGARPVVPPLCTPRDRHVAQLLGRGAPRSGGFRPA